MPCTVLKTTNWIWAGRASTGKVLWRWENFAGCFSHWWLVQALKYRPVIGFLRNCYQMWSKQWSLWLTCIQLGISIEYAFKIEPFRIIGTDVDYYAPIDVEALNYNTIWPNDIRCWNLKSTKKVNAIFREDWVPTNLINA